MLNDLFKVEQGLAAGGIAAAGRHPDVKDMAKGPALRVRLGLDGGIVSLDIVLEAGRGALWTLRDGQHNGFPGLRTASGLLALDAEARQAHQAAWDADTSPAARRAELLRLIEVARVDADQIRTWPNAGHRKRIAERLETLRILADQPETAAVPAAFARFLRAIEGAPSFLEDLAAKLARYAREREHDWVELARMACVGPIALAIDVPEAGLDPGGFERDATDPRQVAAVSAALSASPGLEPTGAPSPLHCALAGTATRLHAGNAPQPNLPGLGQSYIYARNPDIPSLTRYGLTGDASFPVGADLMQRLAGAVDHLTRPDMKDRTWRLIPAETGDKPDLLIVSFLDPAARAAAALADSGPIGETALRELGTRVIDHLSGKASHGAPEHDMTVLILRTVDPANRKAILHHPVQPVQLRAAAQRWLAAVANRPDWLGFPLPVKGAKGAPFTRPWHVAPLSLTSVSSQAFVAGGTRRVAVAGLTAATALQIFLQAGDDEGPARAALRLLLRRHTALLAGLTLAVRRDTLSTFDPKADLRRSALSSLSWIGALLHRLGLEKEKYVQNPGFLLGQLLATADAVHVGYCADLRGGSIPMTLLGNSVFGIAGKSPVRALTILQQRLKPYLAWATPERPSFREKIDAPIAKASPIRAEARDLKKDGKIMEAEERFKKAAEIDSAAWRIKSALDKAESLRKSVPAIAEALKSLKVDEMFQAQLLLGYMAGPTKTDEGQRGASDLTFIAASKDD